ncbi:DNA-binding response regulator, OmpR family, contains REC and winged-helix (wHTH) domain [Tindallia magadiensis]|uniref:Heme response regulator HssR n=2 Tax=Tindallia magadiensis TaxID=69895 RepID=A0A1I3E6D2_9FIRM|nr:response regulator transcription factor [Tindallia magadiensis]SFH94542.1 DNA-binding response regulator, OmpR family, contains REC and winged-helix (wHTH) domain [Tindallia magadiensis]
MLSFPLAMPDCEPEVSRGSSLASFFLIGDNEISKEWRGSMFRILVVEDDKNLQKLMEAVLKQNGYQVLSASDGEEALDLLDRYHVDLMISDIMMPEMDGYELTDSLRKADYQLPILMVTAKESMEDKKQGFMVGTDDYMVKPIDMDEMLLRVAALLRRARIMNEHRITVGKTILDYDTLSVRREGEQVTLPNKEFSLLFKLLSYPRQIFTRQQLMDEIWGLEVESDERTVDVHIKRLRERFSNWPDFDILTVRGLGYKAEKRENEV